MTPVTEHFALEEFASHDLVCYPPEWISERLLPLCTVLERIRAELGGLPVHILSGYRSAAHNQAVGGVPHSQHLQGRAADIVVDGVEPVVVHAHVGQLFNAGQIEIGGLGLYPSFVHVDIRPRPADGHLAQWTGSGFGSEQA